MASNQIQEALRTAASKVLDRKPSDEEVKQLVEAYESAAGSETVKARESLRKFASIKAKSLSDDNLDRIVTDIQNALKPRP